MFSTEELGNSCDQGIGKGGKPNNKGKLPLHHTRRSLASYPQRTFDSVEKPLCFYAEGSKENEEGARNQVCLEILSGYAFPQTNPQ